MGHVVGRRDMNRFRVYILSPVERRNGHGVACRLRIFKRIRQLGEVGLCEESAAAHLSCEALFEKNIPKVFYYNECFSRKAILYFATKRTDIIKEKH